MKRWDVRWCLQKIGPVVLGSFGKYMKSGGFHEIRRISWLGRNRRISWPWNLVDFMKSAGFHEIWRISWLGGIRQISWPWNLADFMKFAWFHEIWQISPWNLADFMPRTLVLMKNTAFSGRPCNTVYLYWFWRKIHYSWNPADFMVKSGRFHGEIWWISWNQANFMKSGRFHDEIQQISSMKSGRFHGWSWKMQTWKCKFL